MLRLKVTHGGQLYGSTCALYVVRCRNCSLTLRIMEYGSEVMEDTRVGFAVGMWSLAVDAKVDLRRNSYSAPFVPLSWTRSAHSARVQYGGAAPKSHTHFGGVMRVPGGCQQGARKVGRRDDHRGEADRTLLGATPDDLTLRGHESTISS
ncbi:hypothetical protein EDB86DRAFT_2883157 [Lactarius hatsudake]|nr:hypothetical protein EDB86DRAFT_2883157 [Lactarius hatsudake]